MNQRHTLEIKWGTSRGRETYGYTTCSLYVDGRKVESCNGGGYDMEGTVIGNYIARRFSAELCKLSIPHTTRNGEPVQEYYDLTFRDPNYNPASALVEGETVEAREAAGKSLGLERYQAFHSDTSRVPTERHTVPMIDGGCGLRAVEEIIRAVGCTLRHILTRGNLTVYHLDPTEGSAGE
jgi:hypothetical protein